MQVTTKDNITMTVPDVILIDGPRGAGKSTIAQLLASHLVANGVPATYFKKGPSALDQEHVNAITHLDHFAYLTREQGGGVIICDRFHASELVMTSFTNRRDMRAMWTDVMAIEREVTKRNCLHVILLADIETLSQRITSRAVIDEANGVEPRGWDVHPDAVWPLWTLAHAALPSSVLRLNQNHDAQLSIINQLAAIYGVTDEQRLEVAS